MTADVRRAPRRGTPSRMRHKAYAPDARTRNRRMCSGDASFTRSFDPCTSILTTHHGGKTSGGEALASASRLGKPTQVGGTSTGVGVSGRSAARRMFISGASSRAGHVEEKEGGRGLRPCEDQEPRLGCPHVELLLQKSVGDVWSRISSANALQKERSGSSERGPSAERRSAGETVGRRVERKVRRESASPAKTGEDRRKTQGGTRVSFSGHDIAESGGMVVGPGP